MAVITKRKVFLQYGRAGEIGPYGHEIKEDAEMFVNLDSASGGYPYATSIDHAHNFKTIAEAERYIGSFTRGLHVREVNITYEF